MTLTVAGKNLTLDGGIEPDSISLHTADPTSAGTVAEVTGGSYTRQAIAFTAAASAGAKAMDGAVNFAIPAGTTVSHYALWQGGVCVDTGTLPASESYTAAGTHTVNSLTISI